MDNSIIESLFRLYKKIGPVSFKNSFIPAHPEYADYVPAVLKLESQLLVLR